MIVSVTTTGTQNCCFSSISDRLVSSIGAVVAVNDAQLLHFPPNFLQHLSHLFNYAPFARQRHIILMTDFMPKAMAAALAAGKVD